VVRLREKARKEGLVTGVVPRKLSEDASSQKTTQPPVAPRSGDIVHSSVHDL